MANFTDRIMRLLALCLLLLTYFCKAHYQIKCSNSTKDTTSMVPSEDGVKGRYIVEWCTNIAKSDTEWNLEIIYNRKNVRICAPKNVHSTKTVKINSGDVNCSFVCLSTDVDLIFSACYLLQSDIKSHGSMRTNSQHNIPNGYSMDTFTNTVFTANYINHGDYISVNFYLGTVPATDYELVLCKLDDTSYDKVSYK
ncbi:unnamed protein product [Diatraea saccharalis]|uniref:Uncharacterized protein n=1 Tax=Diatraea saccharalis TaxID=40085 RepID=A0A9N9WC33_9NEOP|nr:unnamed protein product [Diatraea saccharalis]